MLSLSALLCGSSESLEGHFSAQEDVDLSPAGCAQLVAWEGYHREALTPLRSTRRVSVITSWFFGVENFPGIPVVTQSTRFLSHRFILQPVVSQSVGGGTVGEDPCGLNSHFLPSLPPLLRTVTEQVPSPQAQAMS